MQYAQVRIHDAVATITMDRAGKCNALHPQLIQDLQTAFSDVHQEKRVKSVVVTSAGDHFCAGIDFESLADVSRQPEPESVTKLFSYWSDLGHLYETMLRYPKVIVAAVDGHAFGAGLGLALAADIMVVTDRSRLAANAVRYGLVGGATNALLTFRLGAATASRLALTGQSIDGAEANRLGLCGEPVDSQQVWVHASEIGAQASSGPQEAIQANKRVLNETIGEQLLSQISACSADSATACTTESAREGINAFLQRRIPEWP